jgi:hypothetical protein
LKRNTHPSGTYEQAASSVECSIGHRAVATIGRSIGTLLLALGFVSAHGAKAPPVPDQKKRVGNWYYISGTDGMFRVPRFVAAVHDTTASTSLIFTCQVRPGVKPAQDVLPMMTAMLGTGVGRQGQQKTIKMRFDKTPVFDTTWVGEAADLSSLKDNAQADPLRLLLRIAGNKHRVLEMEWGAKRLDFDLDGATPVILQMFDTCIKPAMGIEATSKKARRK